MKKWQIAVKGKNSEKKVGFGTWIACEYKCLTHRSQKQLFWKLDTLREKKESYNPNSLMIKQNHKSMIKTNQTFWTLRNVECIPRLTTPGLPRDLEGLDAVRPCLLEIHYKNKNVILLIQDFPNQERSNKFL